MIPMFIYGSLRKGQFNYWRLMLQHYAEIQGRATINAKMFSLGEFPAIKLDKESKVVGELMYIHEGITKLIDAMELDAGYDKVAVIVDNEGEKVVAFTYVMNYVPRWAETVKSGDWVKHIGGEA